MRRICFTSRSDAEFLLPASCSAAPREIFSADSPRPNYRRRKFSSVVRFTAIGFAVDATVDLNYFLFGRAVHLFQDAFSSEHIVRIPEDNYERIREVKSYLCTAGCEQHSHSQDAVIDFTSGDVIWKVGTRSKVGWENYKTSNMKPDPLVALEATKDLWVDESKSAAYLNRKGNREQTTAHWVIEGLPE